MYQSGKNLFFFIKEFIVNTKQVQQLKIAFGVVVFLGVGNCLGKVNISPSGLKALITQAAKAVKPVAPAESEDWSIEMLPSDLNHFDEQLGTIEEKLDKRSDELIQVKKMIAELQDRDPSHPYLLQLEEVKKALLMLKDRLVEIEKSQRGAVNVDHRVNVHVGGNRDASLGAISTAGYVFGKLCDAVKYFGPSIVNYYVVSQAFALMREHRDAMMAMMTEMQRMMAEQAARAGQSVPTPPQMPNSGAEAGGSWVNTLSAAAFILPILYKMLQEGSSPLSKSDAELVMVPVQPEPRAWRIIGGEKIPVR